MRGAEVGEWDRAIREVTVAREESSDELETNYLSWGLITFAAWRGDDVTSELARLTAWAESIGESGAADAVHDLRAQVDFAAGRFGAACTEWMAFAPSDPLNAPTAYFYAGSAGLMAVDRDRAAAALAGLQGTPGRGRVRVIDRRLLGAGLAALDGREQDALREARAVIGEYGRLGLPWRQAMVALVLLSTIGAGEAEVRAAAESAREILARLGEKPFLEQLDEALARPPDRAGRPATPSSTAPVTRP